jgi:hypothetical protein
VVSRECFPSFSTVSTEWLSGSGGTGETLSQLCAISGKSIAPARKRQSRCPTGAGVRRRLIIFGLDFHFALSLLPFNKCWQSKRYIGKISYSIGRLKKSL